MRKVTQQIAEAFKNYQKCTISNTMTDGQAVYLHGNKIVWRDPNSFSGLMISMCGWGTPTTHERINGILNVLGAEVGVGQRNHQQGFVYPDGSFEPIDSQKAYSVFDCEV